MAGIFLKWNKMIIEKRKAPRTIKKQPIQFDFAASNYHPTPNLNDSTPSKILIAVIVVEILVISTTILGFMGLL